MEAAPLYPAVGNFIFTNLLTDGQEHDTNIHYAVPAPPYFDSSSLLPSSPDSSRLFEEGIKETYLEECEKLEIDSKFMPRTCQEDGLQGTLLSLLPTGILVDVILPMIGPPSCDLCWCDVDVSDDPSTDKMRAIYLEETTRNFVLFRERIEWKVNRQSNHGWGVNRVLVGMTLGVDEKIVFQQEEFGLRFELDLIKLSPTNRFKKDLIKLSPTDIQKISGKKYQAEKEQDLLGPFRFCLLQRPVRSFEGYLFANQKVHCRSCALKEQRKHCTGEIKTLRSAHVAAAEAWFQEQIEEQEQIEKFRKMGVPPSAKSRSRFYKQIEKVRNKRDVPHSAKSRSPCRNPQPRGHAGWRSGRGS